MTKKRIHLIYGITLSVMLVISGVCLCVACIGIYLSGEQPFSQESVAKAFGYIAIPMYLCLALIAGGFFLDGFAPLEKKKPADRQYRMILAGLQEKLNLDCCDTAVRTAILAQRTKRFWLRTSGLYLLVVCSAIFLVYALNPDHFHQSEINASMLRAMALFFPCLVVPFGYGVFAAYAETKSIRQEIELIRAALSAGARANTTETPPQKKNVLLILRLAIIYVGLGILVYGFFNGGTADVLTKAVNICTECVGLG